MAQTDTGLGWSADSAYLMLSAGEMCTFGGFEISGYPGLPLPVTGPSAQDIYTNGYKVLEGYDKEVYAGAAVNNCFVDAVANTGGFSLYFIAPTNEADSIYWVERNKTSGAFSNVKLRTCSSQAAVSHGVQFYSSGGETFLYWDTNIVFYAPHYNRDWEYVAALTFNGTPIYKLNPGYAVACIATWITPDGVTITSPVLISTSADNATLSLDGTTPASQGRATILYDGVWFIMSYLTNLDGYGSGGVPIVDLSQFAAATPEKVFRILATDSFANIIVGESPDPYQEGGESEPGGSDGEEDVEDEVDFTDPPSTSIGATGFLTIFCPSLTELRSLATFMWSSFDVDNWRKLFANPMDVILGLHIIPVPAVITGTKAVKVGGIDTTIDMSYTTIRYIRRSMGTCDVPKKWGAYLDYNPYTKMSVFLPYIGFKEIDADDVMGKTIALQYIIDILTGACVAELKCGDTVMYSWQGNCANEVPISGSDWRGAITSALGIAATVATTVATGGASAPMIAGTIASVGANSLNLKPTINRSGSISGSAGFIGHQRPYIIRTIPNLVIPADQNKYIGYPSFVTMPLGSLSGYNEISSIHLEGIPATGAELDELEAILKGGVIF